MITYKIIRFFFRNEKKDIIIKTNLTLEEAVEHCSNSETSSQTCKNNPYPNEIWFDGYVKE